MNSYIFFHYMFRIKEKHQLLTYNLTTKVCSYIVLVV